jgi:hypothetical protein
MDGMLSFLNSHRHVAYSEDFISCRNETFIANTALGSLLSLLFCRIYIGLKVKILTSHVKIDVAIGTKILPFL